MRGPKVRAQFIPIGIRTRHQDTGIKARYILTDEADDDIKNKGRSEKSGFFFVSVTHLNSEPVNGDHIRTLI